MNKSISEKLLEIADENEDRLEIIDKRVIRIIQESNVDVTVGRTQSASLLLM